VEASSGRRDSEGDTPTLSEELEKLMLRFARLTTDAVRALEAGNRNNAMRMTIEARYVYRDAKRLLERARAQ
jgi:predicted component of type VI protein secretion system